MVNTSKQLATRYRLTTSLIGGYVAIVVATLVVLAALSGIGSPLATGDAWGHAIIVAMFAVLLPLRLRAARRGSSRAGWAVVIIAGVLLVVNVVEAALPQVFPTWMRWEMVSIAVLMAGTMLTAIRRR